VARPATGQLLVREGKRGRVYAARFRAYGQREYVTLGSSADGWTEARARLELENILADVRRGIWQAPEPAPVVEAREQEPTFHEFASEWVASRTVEGIAASTLKNYEWALSYHLLPYFKDFRMSEFTVRDVDAYKTLKAKEGVIAANAINQTLQRLAQILDLAVEYGHLPANPARGRRRRLPKTKPRRPFVEPEQLMCLLRAAEGLYDGRGRPLLGVLAGAGLRIGEALALQRRDVNLARGTLTIRQSKTEAGVRTVDLTPALRDELALWLDRAEIRDPTALVFRTGNGNTDNRHNVHRMLTRAITRANKRLTQVGIEPIGPVSPHGLRRTFASLRTAAGDDPVYIAAQIGHTDVTFTLSVYARAVKHRQRLTEHEREQYELAIEWAQMGTSVYSQRSVGHRTVAFAASSSR
jgi:integrase